MEKRRKLPIVALVGRPNVGKSTLFNRIVGARKAVVHDTPGLTRDRNYEEAEWEGRHFIVVDTGGYEIEAPSRIYEQMREQTQLAIDEAAVVVFLCDVREGISPTDQDIAGLLRKADKQVCIVVNKCDNQQLDEAATEFYSMGFENTLPVSALHGRGSGDLLDRIVESLPDVSAMPELPENLIRISIIGRQNVGKSTLVNSIIGEERVIANPIPGTTRDAVDTFFNYDGRDYMLIDTAGLRRRGKISYGVEKLCSVAAQISMQRSDIAFLVIDGSEEAAKQDAHIGGFAHDSGCGVIIVVNKWDLVEKETQTFMEYQEKVRFHMPFLGYAPMISVSAKTGQRAKKILSLANSVMDEYTKELSTSELNVFLEMVTKRFPPPIQSGKRLKIKYITQVASAPPRFVLFVNNPKLMHFSYRRYLVNQFRRSFGFEGVPIKIILREK